MKQTTFFSTILFLCLLMAGPVHAMEILSLDDIYNTSLDDTHLTDMLASIPAIDTSNSQGQKRPREFPVEQSAAKRIRTSGDVINIDNSSCEESDNPVMEEESARLLLSLSNRSTNISNTTTTLCTANDCIHPE